MVPKDYYSVLGVGRDADDAELKRAYRTLARQHHPDKNPGNARSEERFKEISEAYAVLSDPGKRAQYDRFGTVSGPGGGPEVAVALLLGQEGLGFERLAETTDLLLGCQRQRVGVRGHIVVAHDTSKYSRREQPGPGGSKPAPPRAYPAPGVTNRARGAITRARGVITPASGAIYPGQRSDLSR